MSNKYSLGGYRLALQARTAKTIFVEGKDDKDLFDTIRLGRDNAAQMVIDTHEILNDAELTGLGAKARIDYLISTISPTSPVRSKLCCFVDREWEELIDHSNSNPLPWTAPIETDIRLKTSGHSIENYGFTYDFVELYLRHFGQSVATAQVLSAVSTALPEILRAAAAFSEVARKRHLVKKSYDVVQHADISWINSKINLSPVIETRISARGAPNAAGFIGDFLTEYHGKWSGGPLASEAHLHAHGHLGEMIMWAAIANIVVNHGFSSAVGQEISAGRRDEKRRVWHMWLAMQPPNNLSPIYKVFG